MLVPSLRCITYLIWDKVFKNGPSKICGRQPLKNLKSMVCLIRPSIGVGENVNC